jgi:hypothetical protein
MIICQHEWVKQCFLRYRHESLPDGEHWEDAHYPLPLCEKGTETVPLWSRDHAVHGVLQSESLQRPCIHGYRVNTDRQLLGEHYPEYLDLYSKWYREHKSRAGKIGGTRGSKEAKSRGGKNGPKEAKSRGGKNQPREVKVEAGRKGGSNTPPEVRRASGIKSTSQRWQCTVTGFVTNAASLSRYQMKRDIDTANRVRLE